MLLFTTPSVIDHTTDTINLADGDHAIADILAAGGVGVDGPHQFIQLGRDDRRLPRLIAEAVSSTLSADATANYALHAGVLIGPKNNPTGLTTFKLGTGTATIGTATGIASGTPDNTHRFADALTWTETAYYTDLRAALDIPAAAVHSPADNTVARLIVGDVGFADVLLLESVAGLKWRVSVGV